MITDSYPLSPIQQGILFESLVASPGTYVIQYILRMQEELDLESLRSALDFSAARHSSLRTGFRQTTAGDFLQEVHSDTRIALQEVDLSGYSPGDQNLELDKFLLTEHQAGFDLQNPPLFRAALFRLGNTSDGHEIGSSTVPSQPAREALIMTTHHAIIDAYSFLRFLKDLFIAYDSIHHDVEPRLEQPVQYRQYVDWMQSRDFSSAEKFWRSRLHGFSIPTRIDLDFFPKSQADQPVSVFTRYQRQHFSVPKALTAALQRIARENDLTLNTIFQGLWGILLGRYSAENDVVFGATRSCRHSALEGNTDSLFGPLLNTLPVRVDLSGPNKLLPWLTDLRRQWVDMRPFENTPLSMISAWSEISPGQPLFQTFCNFEAQSQNAYLHALGPQWQGRSLETIQTTPYPLVISISAAPQVDVNLVYDREYIPEQFARRLAGHFQTLAEEIACHPERSLGELNILTAAERAQILVDWNHIGPGKSASGAGSSLLPHQRFEKQVDRFANRVAVVEGWDDPRTGENRQLTYHELNARANQLAQHLQKLGVGPEVRVGVCMQRSLELVIAFLGILKSGGVFSPLDPEYPPDRLAFLIHDSGPQVVLTQSFLLPQLPAGLPQLLCLDTDWDQIASQPRSNPFVSLAPANLAYVIYTSGTTGQPKGVMVPHRALNNILDHMLNTYDFTAEDRDLALTPISFDPSIWDWILPFLFGGLLVLAKPGGQADPRYLIELTQRWGITIWHIVTSLVDLILDEPSVVSCSSVRYVITGGENMPPSLPGKIFRHLDVGVTNGYGPTETCIRSTMTWLDADIDWSFNSIGRPIENTRVYILDRDLQPLPIGLAGQVFIGGSGLARGYLHQPALTADRFIPDPFGEPGSRLYRTGDLARYRPDGQIEFLGRIDNQVKLNGVRIELEEIERVLESDPRVSRAAVLLQHGRVGTHLAAYVEKRAAAELGTRDLKELLKARLPASMLPSAYFFLESLPRLPGGKLDRKALSALTLEPSSPPSAYHPPTTPLERVISSVFVQVLDVYPIGLSDDFFELGGHSLHLMQAVARINELFGLSFSLRALIENPTVEGIAFELTSDPLEAGRLDHIARSILDVIDQPDQFPPSS